MISKTPTACETNSVDILAWASMARPSARRNWRTSMIASVIVIEGIVCERKIMCELGARKL